MIKYRPHRGTLAEAMLEAREFDNEKEMKEYIAEDWNRFLKGAFTEEDIIIEESHGNDDRIGWKDVRYVCVKRMGNQKYEHPQCIGMCGE